jgi:hypothetical protein
VIKHYETTPGKDEMQQEQRRDIKEKVSTQSSHAASADLDQLEKTLAQLQAKTAELQAERESEIAAAEGGLFETGDPAYNQHVVRSFRTVKKYQANTFSIA